FLQTKNAFHAILINFAQLKKGDKQ
ncbi:MAG: hypothetical protein RLZZ118_640, partial [Bacteroidota bacterium]